jgi:CheY-like chemotaxis protein
MRGSPIGLQKIRRHGLTWGPPAPNTDETVADRRWVLIADDDEVIRQLWAEALTQAGYRTIEARGGQAAVDLMCAVVPDLIILDLHMPDLSGDDLLQRLRPSPVLRGLPVLIVSGFLEGEPHDTSELNIVGMLSKPISLAELLPSVKSALTMRVR